MPWSERSVKDGQMLRGRVLWFEGSGVMGEVVIAITRTVFLRREAPWEEECRSRL